jgi:hypothetical protein
MAYEDVMKLSMFERRIVHKETGCPFQWKISVSPHSRLFIDHKHTHKCSRPIPHLTDHMDNNVVHSCECGELIIFTYTTESV